MRAWQPGRGAVVFMNVAGLVLLVVGLAGYAAVWSARGGGGSFTLSGGTLLLGLAVTVVVTALLMVVHEGIHGLVVRCFGGTPRFGAMMIGRIIPALYCTAPGVRFSKARFLTVALAPLVVLGVGCAVATALAPFGGWLVVPAAIHLSGCAGDLAMSWVAARQPRGTRIEDVKSGMRFHD